MSGESTADVPEVPAGAPNAGAGANANTGEDLDRLSTEELHDRALHRAEHHLDVRFFWNLLEMIPAAEAAQGDVVEADFDVQHSRRLIAEAMRSDGEIAEALRPVFIDYLRKRPGA